MKPADVVICGNTSQQAGNQGFEHNVSSMVELISHPLWLLVVLLMLGLDAIHGLHAHGGRHHAVAGMAVAALRCPKMPLSVPAAVVATTFCFMRESARAQPLCFRGCEGLCSSINNESIGWVRDQHGWNT